jgi:tetratricopeptide (TPR) repeat protein
MYRPVLFILFVLSCNRPSAGKISDTVADSIINVMRTDVQLSLNQLKFGEAFNYLDSIYEQVEQTGHAAVKSSWFRCKGSVFMLDRRYDSASIYLHKAHAVAQTLDSINKYLIDSKRALLNCFAHQQQYDSALHYGLQGYYLARNYDTSQIAKIGSVLAQVYDRMGDTASKRKYLFEAYQHITNAEEKLVLANNIAKYYFDVGKIDSAIIFNAKTNSDSVLNLNPLHKSAWLANQGVLFIEHGNLETALRYLKAAIELDRTHDRLNERAYLNIAEIYSRQNKFERSNRYVDTALAIARQHHDHYFLSEGFRERADNERVQGRLHEAIQSSDSSRKYHEMNDSISYILKAQELEKNYSIKAKDEKIAALAFANSANLKISRQQRTIIVTIVLMMLSLAAAAVLLWRRRQMQVQLREAELQLLILSNQIKPHFIFNALGVLQSFIRSDHSEKSLDYLTRFSRLLRLDLENSRHQLVSVDKELESLESYLHLQAMHFEGLFEYSIVVAPEFDKNQIFIPPMMIQPFVENAIIHGFMDIAYKGSLSVRIEKTGNVLRCIIEDNGSGLRTMDGTASRPHATSITQERLELLRRQTGKQARLTIVDKQKEHSGQGVRVTMDIPFLTNNQEKKTLYWKRWGFNVKQQNL